MKWLSSGVGGGRGSSCNAVLLELERGGLRVFRSKENELTSLARLNSHNQIQLSISYVENLNLLPG